MTDNFKDKQGFKAPEETDDVEGHVRLTGGPGVEGDPNSIRVRATDSDDVEGHVRLTGGPGVEGGPKSYRAAPTDSDDVEGHVQPPRDVDVEPW